MANQTKHLTLKNLYFLLLISFSQFSFGQNLVPNPSFEIYDTCPSTLSQIDRAVGWNSVRPSPDYYNTCAPTGGQSVHVPNNFFGYQYPASGNGYAGFAAKTGYFQSREYLGTALINPLQIGLKYFVSLKVSLSTNENTGQFCGVNKLGVLFSTIHYSVTDSAPICNCAQVYTNTIITDTTNWTMIKGSFIADSGYSFISIGNFFDDALTDSTQIEGTSCVAYYYLDDICVSTDSAYSYNYIWTGINNIITDNLTKCYPNPFNNIINIEDLSNNLKVFKLFDCYGRLLKTQESNLSSHFTWNLSDLSQGIYNLSIQVNNLTIFNHLIIKL